MRERNDMTVGEARVFRPGEGRQFFLGTDETGKSRFGTVKIESGTADFSVFESSPAPGEFVAPPHIHRSYDEGFYVIEGTVDFFLSERREHLEAGSFVLVPRGVSHGFANLGPGEARLLIIGSPPIQRLVEEVGRLAAAAGGIRPQPEDVIRVFRRFGTELGDRERLPDLSLLNALTADATVRLGTTG
jgi:mannose-6-phosphate isomerase-like protein (cupin superfamily)